MVATGLSESPQAYRTKLLEQSDSQIDAWATGSLRDMAKRKGIVATIHEFSHAAHLDEDGLAGAYTLGGGPAATMGRDAEGDSFSLRSASGASSPACARLIRRGVVSDWLPSW